MMKLPRRNLVWLTLLVTLLSTLTLIVSQSCAPQPTGSNSSKPTVADAEKFIADAEKKLNDLGIKSSRAEWVKSNFITDDTESLAADANEKNIAAVTELAEASRKFDGLDLPADVARKIKLLKLSL